MACLRCLACLKFNDLSVLRSLDVLYLLEMLGWLELRILYIFFRVSIFYQDCRVQSKVTPCMLCQLCLSKAMKHDAFSEVKVSINCIM